MTSSNWLLVFITATIGLTAYLIATAPTTSNEDLDDMEEDWWS